jgi:hypothetical protein
VCGDSEIVREKDKYPPFNFFFPSSLIGFHAIGVEGKLLKKVSKKGRKWKEGYDKGISRNINTITHYYIKINIIKRSQKYIYNTRVFLNIYLYLPISPYCPRTIYLTFVWYYLLGSGVF